jgi:TolB-like protein/Tfp pilus assembly protein PilF
MPEDRRLAAIMFTDIVGYTALMGSDEDKAFDMLKRNHTIHAALIEKHNGTLIKEVGDGTLASFSLGSDAVRCAIDIQKEAKSQNIPLKIGIHEGEMVMAGEDILGDGVNVASRLQEISADGSITISGRVYSDVKNKAGIKTKFIGDKRLKNVEDPVKVYEVLCEEEVVTESKEQPRKSNKWLYFVIAGLIIVVAAIWILYNLPKQPDIEIEKSIAVLPFRNDSPDPENEYFCNGMMETILNHLVKVGDLKVMSRTDVEPFRNTSKSRKEIASELNVANILEGSVYRIGNKFRISIQLINPENGFHLWSNEYEGEYTEEVFSIQSNIAREVASALKAVITPEEEQSIEIKPTTDIKAYDFMIRGQEEMLKYWATRDTELLKLAHRLIDKALEIDPQYIDAMATKGNTYVAEQKYDSAIMYAKRMLEIDPENGRGYFLLGESYSRNGEYDAAVENYLLAIKHYNQNAEFKIQYAYLRLGYIYCMNKNDYEQGIPYLQKSIEKSDEVDFGHWIQIGNIFSSMGDYERAEKYYQKTLNTKDGECMGLWAQCLMLNLNGKFDHTIHFLDSICSLTLCDRFCTRSYFWTYLMHGQYEQSEKYFSQYIDIIGTTSTSDSIWLAFLYKKLGREQESNSILSRLRISVENQLTQNIGRWYILDPSMVLALLDDKEESLKYLSEAVNLGLWIGWHDYLEVNPLFENLWNDPEFKALVKRAQDEKAAIRAQVQEMIDNGEIDL